MSKPDLRSSFVLRVFSEDSKQIIKLQNLKTAEIIEFRSYRALLKYLKAMAIQTGLR